MYENNESIKGDPIFSFSQPILENNLVERDIASFILKMEKSNEIPINSLLVAKFILANKKRLNSVSELIDFIFHQDDFKPAAKIQQERFKLEARRENTGVEV